jgi:hypothetical protein
MATLASLVGCVFLRSPSATQSAPSILTLAERKCADLTAMGREQPHAKPSPKAAAISRAWGVAGLRMVQRKEKLKKNKSDFKTIPFLPADHPFRRLFGWVFDHSNQFTQHSARTVYLHRANEASILT